MGISGLLPLLKEIQVSGHISEFKGKRLAVDAYVWLHKGAFGCAEDLVKGKKTTKFVDYAMHRVRLLRYHGITPFVVFDGGPLPAKKGTEVSRAKSRAENLERARAMESQGRWREARDFYTRCLDITPEMAFQLIKALRAENVDYVVAPYEADAQLCFLEREGYVDGIITEDSDLLVFGCRQVVFKLDGDGHCVWIHRDKLAGVRDFPMHGWTDVQFRRMAMLSGCDYLDSIPGIGLKTAHRLLRRFNTVEKLLQHVRLEGTLAIPANYLTDFAQAELAFIHQRVYHPHQCKLVPLNDFPEGGLNDTDEKWIGLDVEDHIAKGMARGDIHPETRLPIVDEWPDFKPVARSRPLAESSKANIPVGAGPMDAFVTRMKKPRPLPKPVGTLSSGPSRLSDQLQERPSAPLGLGVSADEASGPVKRSKFFSQPTKRKSTPEPAVQLVWEDSDEIETQPIADSSRSESQSQSQSQSRDRSPSIRSPSPAISSIQGDEEESCSPVKSVFSEGHVLTSPGAPLFSSPVCSSPGGIPFTTPRKKEQRVREDTPPSPTGATVARSVLIAASSQIWGESMGSVKTELTLDTITPARRGKATSRVSSLVPCSSPVDVDLKPWPQSQSQSRSTLPIKTKTLGASSSTTSTTTTTSSDTAEDDEIVTPSLDQLRNKRKRTKSEVKEEEEPTEEEVRSQERAKAVAQGWRAKYAFGQSSSSSSPAISSDVDDRAKAGVKRTKSEPTRRCVQAQNQNQNQTPRPRLKPEAIASTSKRALPLPIMARARVLMEKKSNVPSPSPSPYTGEHDRSGEGMGMGMGMGSGSKRIVPPSSDPIVISDLDEDEDTGEGEGKHVQLRVGDQLETQAASASASASGKIRGLGVAVAPSQAQGDRWSKLQKYKCAFRR